MVTNQGDLGDLRLDTREWGEHTVGDDESDDDDEDDLDDDQDWDNFGSGDALDGAMQRKQKKRSAANKAQPKQQQP